eukprot:NODE_66_length_25735_cov_0.318497.p13 type:complete len:314 gc:universal NODE_66_length_25735_cov_0.318497:15847-14906(-)
MKQENVTAFRKEEKFYQHTKMINVPDLVKTREFIKLNCCITSKIKNCELQILNTPLPGCLVIRDALSIEEQQTLIFNSIAEYPQRFPNVLQKDYEISEMDLFQSYLLKDETLINERQFDGICPVTNRPYARKNITAVEAHTLLKKLRWTIIGREFDWVNREYKKESFEVPNIINNIVQKVMSQTSKYTKYDKMKLEAGVINYYKFKDRMMAHVDHSETNMNIPLASISLGTSCVLLMGTASRDDKPVPIKLNSGDILLMYSKCRYGYHGVPRIIETNFDFLSKPLIDEPLFPQVFKYLKDHQMRININARQID